MGSLFGAGWSFDPVSQVAESWQAWKEVRDGYTTEQLAEDFDSAVEVRGDDPVMGVYTSPDWVGFATDGGGNQLAVDLAPLPGRANTARCPPPNANSSSNRRAASPRTTSSAGTQAEYSWTPRRAAQVIRTESPDQACTAAGTTMSTSPLSPRSRARTGTACGGVCTRACGSLGGN